jgi:hypothetical protein
MQRRKTFINPIQEVDEVERPLMGALPHEAGFQMMIDEEVMELEEDKTKDKYTDKIKKMRGTVAGSSEKDFVLDHQNSMDFFLFKKKYNKRSNSMHRMASLAKAENTDKDEVISKVIEDNRKLEEQIEKMHEFGKENEELRNELITATYNLTEHEKQMISEKDKKMEELANTLNEREIVYNKLYRDFNELRHLVTKEPTKESKFQRLIEEKEEELDKINHMNASYRAQLIELKISMSKARDANRNNQDDEYAVKIDSPEAQLEEAKDKIAYRDSKIDEQNSIIDTLLVQAEYYKNKYGE